MSKQEPLRRSAMPQSSTLYVGLEGHKEWSALLHHRIAQYQNIHARAKEAIEGLSRPVHDRLILVLHGSVVKLRQMGQPIFLELSNH